MPGSEKHTHFGAVAYIVLGSFVGGSAGGAWFGLVLMSTASLYGTMGLWEDLLAGTVAGTAVAALSILCGWAAGRLAGIRVVLAASVATLNVAVVLYFFGEWVCQVSPAGPAFTKCRIPAPLGGLSLLDTALLVFPTALAAILGAFVTVRGLLRDRTVHRRKATE